MKSFLSKSLRAGALQLVIGAAILAAASFVGACTDDQQKAVASNVDRVSILIKDGREIRDVLVEQNLIDSQDAYRVTIALQKVNTALKTFTLRAQTYQSTGALTPEGKADLRKLAEDISSAAVELIADGTFNVKNPQAQQKLIATIGAIKQATLAIIDSVSALKAKPPIQTQNTSPLAAIPLLLAALRQIVGFVQAERARTGKTSEEIYADANVQIDANDIALTEDLIKYAPVTEDTPTK